MLLTSSGLLYVQFKPSFSDFYNLLPTPPNASPVTKPIAIARRSTWNEAPRYAYMFR